MTTYNQLKYPPSSIGNSSIAAGAVSPDKLDSDAQRAGFKNRIINGDMRIDQRNAGASVTPTNTGAFTYTLDRWGAYGTVASKFSVQQNAGAVAPPLGFKNYIGVTSLSAYSVTAGDWFGIKQIIEGYNIADLGWGTSSARAITLSFQVYSSLTGTFGGALWSGDGARSYAFSYTVSSANTWTSIAVTIAGDTTGTWNSTNGAGLNVEFSLGAGSTNSGTAGAWSGSFYTQPSGATSVVGTSGATFYITGVQLEVGTQATTFDYRSITQELLLCQRYYFVAGGSIRMYADISGGYCSSVPPVIPRTTPTMTLPSSGTGSGVLVVGASGTNGIYTLIKTTSGAAFVNADSYLMAGSAEL